MADTTTIDALRDRARADLGRVLGTARTVALVNFPNHGNPGDPAIWLGSERLLRDLGVRVGYRCAWWNFDPDGLRRAVGDAPVLVQGGGNFGDLYAEQQGTRVQVLTTLRDNPVIQLPQSIHFRDPANLERMAELLAAHGAVTLMVRERRSEAIALDRLGVDPVLSPDHALGMGPLRRTREPDVPVLWLMRSPGDLEFVDHGHPDDPGVRVVRWLEGVADDQKHWGPAGRAILAANHATQRRWRPGTRGARMVHALAARTYDPLARRWVRRGLDILSHAQVVVTNTLHGHVLAAMAGIPTVVLDNSYGKVSGVVEAWTGPLPGVHLATDPDDAIETAYRLASSSSGGQASR